jgi:hypothetical protein
MTPSPGVLLWRRLRLACRVWRQILCGHAVMCGLEMTHVGDVLFRPHRGTTAYSFIGNHFISIDHAGQVFVETSTYGVVPLREMSTD